MQNSPCCAACHAIRLCWPKLTEVEPKRKPTGTAEGVSGQVEPGDGRVKQREGEEYEHPVLNHAGNVHCQRRCLADQQEHCLQAQHVARICTAMIWRPCLQPLRPRPCKNIGVQRLQLVLQQASTALCSTSLHCCDAPKTALPPHQVEHERRHGICQEDRWIELQGRVSQERPDLHQHCTTRGTHPSAAEGLDLRRFRKVHCLRSVVQGLTQGHRQADQARGRDVVQALQRVHVQALAVDQDLHQRQPRSLQHAASALSAVSLCVPPDGAHTVVA